MTIALSTRALTLTNTSESSSRVTMIVSFNPSIFSVNYLFQILFRERKMKDSGEYLLLPPTLLTFTFDSHISDFLFFSRRDAKYFFLVHLKDGALKSIGRTGSKRKH